MGLPNVLQTGISGMVASKVAIATSGHNISNANTEGFSRQRVETHSAPERDSMGSHGYVGTGTEVSRVSRVNDEYLEKQIRTGTRDLVHLEEKDQSLKQVEDIFNEMNGDGINRLIARFFNEFRKLANEPESEAVRQSVREASQALINDFHRIREEVEAVRHHLDTKIEGCTKEINTAAQELKELNIRINQMSLSGASPNDLEDKRDVVLKKLSTFADMASHRDTNGNYVVDLKGVGPLVVGPQVETFSVNRSPADDDGKPEGAYDVKSSSSARGSVTHQIKGGRLGALLEVRDQTLSTVLERLDGLAHGIATAVNEIHSQGFSSDGLQGIHFFKPMDLQHRAAEFIELSDEVKNSASNIATAAIANAPGDNRIAIAISGLQNSKIMAEGKATFDDFYNSIMSDVGVFASRTRSGINQQRDIMAQLNKIRDQISGVSIDEETANLMQFQHTFDASAKVIQIADEMLKTVLELKR